METNKKIILSLIKDDLTNLILIKGLNNLGLEADRYSLTISDSIIKLINNKLTDKENEEVHEYYCDMSSEIIDYQLVNMSLEMQAEEILKEVELMIKNIN